MKKYEIKNRETSYYFLKKDFKSAYENNGHNIELAVSQVALFRDLDRDFVKNILYLYINKIQYDNKICPNCKQDWNGIECIHCSFDTGFDPYWD